MPLCRIPDPFGCCESWSEHFTKVWMDGVVALGMNPKLYSVNDLYLQGKFEPYIKMVFEKRKEVGAIVAKFQKTKSKDYIPFDAICSNCGRLANVDDFNLDEKTVHFVCGGKAIKKKRTEGCGTEDWVPWSEGKLQWRFEWPALWGIFHTTFEPFGKDHAEGSWPSGQEIARKIYNIEPPIPFVYEFFLVNGEKMSASVGNVYIVQDMLKILEPEIFLYFYTKRPGRQRNLDLKNIYYLVDDFEHAERVYFGLEEENEKEKKSLSRMYEAVMQKIPEKPPIRIPYKFAAVVAQISSEKNVIEILRRTGHIKGDISEEDRKLILRRLWYAKNWVENYAPENKIEINDTIPEYIKEKTKQFRESIIELAENLKNDMTEEKLYSLFFEICKKYEIDTKEFFKAIYQILISKDSGPRLAPFILALGKERVKNILEQV
jgi:lysyl-tRNA synthetase class 1